MKCPLFRGGLGARCLPGGRHELLLEGRRGADDEDPRSDFASDGEEDYVVAGSRVRQALSDFEVRMPHPCGFPQECDPRD